MTGIPIVPPSDDKPLTFVTGGAAVAVLTFDVDSGAMTLRPADPSKRLATASTDGGAEVTLVTVPGPPGPAHQSDPPAPDEYRIVAKSDGDGTDTFRVVISCDGRILSEFVTHRELIGPHLAQRQEVFDR